MVDLPKRIEAEKENIEAALANLKLVCSRKDRDVVALAAMATFLHNIYNGIENILKQILKSKGITVPKTDTWHKDLLDISVSKGIISERLSEQLYEYLSFRHIWSQFLSSIKKLS
jgi:uncharacterized protein YutE (UPF0331/DUF86 family)